MGTEAIDWLIVGGGIHGTHIAARLVGEAGLDPARLLIVDDRPRLLARWRARTANTGMRHLRSPAVHHLDLDPWDLKRFASGGHRLGGFAPPYARPALALFDAHCDRVVERYHLAARHRIDRAEAIALADDGARVELASGDRLDAARVVLALGPGDQTAWPDWARALAAGGGPVVHAFDPGVAITEDLPGARLAVVGGGITAAQIALRFVGRRAVHLVSRHPLRIHDFDSDPGWIGPKYLAGFSRIDDPARRRALITAARHRGSVSPGVHRAVMRARDAGTLGWCEGPITGAERVGDTIRLTVDGAAIEVDRVILATGFAARRPGGALVDALAADLPYAPCGFPLVDRHLRWHPRLCVSGGLAELELGPVARNIVGARHAARRILPLAAGAADGARASPEGA